MASDGEEDLEALRKAVLTSMNKTEESDSDEDLEALRQAALRAKNKKNENSNGSAIQASVGFRPNTTSEPNIPVSGPGVPSFGPNNFIQRGPPGAGNARFPGHGGLRGGFRGKGAFPIRPSASNLIVIRTVPLEGEKETKPAPTKAVPINKPLMIRPQDRWAGTADESSQSPTTKPKVSARFRRYESSSSDSDSSDSSDDSSEGESNNDKENENSSAGEKEDGASDEEKTGGSENESDKDDANSDNESAKSVSAASGKSPPHSRSPTPEVSRPPADKNHSGGSSRESSPELSGTRFARPKRRLSQSEDEGKGSPQRSRSPTPKSRSQTPKSRSQSPKSQSPKSKSATESPKSNSSVSRKSSPNLPSPGDRSPSPEKRSALQTAPLETVHDSNKTSAKIETDSRRYKASKLTDNDKYEEPLRKDYADPRERRKPLDRRSKDRSPVSREYSPSRRRLSPVERDRYHRKDRSPVKDNYRGHSPIRESKLSDRRGYDKYSDRQHRHDRFDDAYRSRSVSPSSRTKATSDSKTMAAERKVSSRSSRNDDERRPNSSRDPVLEARRQKFETRKEITAGDVRNTKISLKGITSKKDRSRKVAASSKKKTDEAASVCTKRKEKVAAESEPEDAVESEKDSSSSVSSMSDTDSDDSNDAPWRSKKASERGTGDIEKERRIRAKAHRQMSVEEREERRRRRSVREERRQSRGEYRPKENVQDIRDRLERKTEDKREVLSNSSSNRNERHTRATEIKERTRRVDSWESEDDDTPVKPAIKSLLNVVKATSEVNSSRDNSPSATQKLSIKERLGVKRVSISPVPAERSTRAADPHPRELQSRSKSKERSKSRERRVTKRSPSPVRTELPPNDLRLEKLSKKKRKKKKRRRYSESAEEEDVEMPKVVVRVDKPGRRVMKEDDSGRDARNIIGKKKKYSSEGEEESHRREESPSFHITFDKVKKHGENDEPQRIKLSIRDRLGVKLTPEKALKKHKKQKKEAKPDRRVIADDELLSSHRPRKVVAVEDDEQQISRLKLKRPKKSEGSAEKRVKLSKSSDPPPSSRSGLSHGRSDEAELDAKIKAIQRKNEAINQRQRQIEEEKLRFGR